MFRRQFFHCYKTLEKRIEFTKTSKKCTQNLKRSPVHKKSPAIDTLINCFQFNQMNSYVILHITSGDYKDQNKKSLVLEEADVLKQENDMNA